MKGKLIVFEGSDGCGKTTQIQHLYHWLKHGQNRHTDRPLLLTKEPGATQLGKTLRSLLLETSWSEESLDPLAELMLYAADRAQHVQTMLKPNLAAGAWILCDRYTDSTVAYQGYGRGLDLTQIERLNQIATDNVGSDLTFWLDVSVQTSWERLRHRGKADRMENADRAFYQRVYQGFAALAAQHPERIVRIDGEADEWTIAQQIQSIIQHKLGL